MNKQKQKRRDDRLRDDALETYINSISDLLLDKSLSILAKQKARGTLDTEQQDFLDAGIDVIRAKTLLIFRKFKNDEHSNRSDSECKGSILLFLYETGLIRDQKVNDQGQEDTEPKHFQALLSLFRADLSFTSLSDTDLSGVNLFAANLSYADLSNSDLSNSDFSNSDLTHSDFSDANLSDADLSGAILLAVDLSQTKHLTQEQLEVEEPPLLCKVKLPKDIKVDPNRDCKNLPEVLQERDLERFEDLEEAQAYVDKLSKP